MDREEVGIGQFKVIKGNGELIASSLGSCIALVVYDKINKVGGMAHILASEGDDKERLDKPAMYPEPAVKRLVRKIISYGGEKKNLEAKMAGGARMFSFKTNDDPGKKNIEAVKEALKKRDIELTGEDVRGDKARTVKFDVNSMSMKIEIKI
ncbi:MAG: chemotaxis protein CheD [Candidatus Thermoplasmatota archaeon]